MSVSIDGNEYEVVILRKNNKRLYIRYKDGKIEVSSPKFVSDKEIAKLVNENIDYVKKMIDNDTYDNSCFYYLGKKYKIILSDIEGVFFEDEYVFVKSMKVLDKYYDSEVKRIFTERVELFKDVIEVPEFDLKFRKMKTRWGVCNFTNKNITLNTELLKRDLDLLDYVIVHEMCHFYHQDHSSNFWKCVSLYYPKYKEARKRLRGSL